MEKEFLYEMFIIWCKDHIYDNKIFGICNIYNIYLLWPLQYKNIWLSRDGATLLWVGPRAKNFSG